MDDSKLSENDNFFQQNTMRYWQLKHSILKVSKKEKGDLVWRQKNTVGTVQNRLV